MRSGGRVVEGARLESEYTPKAYRGFESLPLRQAPVPTGSQQSTGLDNIGRNQRIFPPARSYRFVTLRRRSEEHTSELQSLMRISYAVFCSRKTPDEHTLSAELQIRIVDRY